MKKIILLTGIIGLLVLSFSCSKDDDAPVVTPTLSTDLIGTWVLDYYIDGGNLTEEIICSEQIKYVFSKDGKYTKTTFAGDGTTDCSLAVVINGTWKDLGSNSYELTPNGGTAGPALNINFKDNFKKFISVVSATRTEVFSK